MNTGIHILTVICYKYYQVIGFPERTKDDSVVFTMFIITDMIQVRTITNFINTEFYTHT